MSRQLTANSGPQQRPTSKCEKFCRSLRTQNPDIYKSFAQLTQRYSKRKTEKLEYLRELVRLFEGNSIIITELNKLLHMDAKVEEIGADDDEGQEEVKEKVQIILKKVRESAPDKFRMLESQMNMKRQQGINLNTAEGWLNVFNELLTGPRERDVLREIENILAPLA